MILIIYLDLLNNIFDKYSDPQPLIKIFGKNIIEWIIDYINIKNFSNVIIIYNNELYKSKIENIFLNKFAIYYFNKDSNIFDLICNNLNNYNDESILFIDSKKFYIENLSLLSQNNNNNIIFYINEEIENLKNVYLITDNNNKLMNFLSKTKISDNVIVGAFKFNSFFVFKEYCYKLNRLNTLLFTNNNITIIQLINLMINDNLEIDTYKLNNEDVISLESPFHIRLFCNNFPKINAINNDIMIYKQRICFEIEDILLKDNSPIQNNIDFLKYLKKIGNTIIIYSTATYFDKNKDVINILAKNEIYYDEIYFNKPEATFYIDTKNIILDNNLEKQLGYYNNKINSRDFNDVTTKDIKTYKKMSNNLSGEIYYYLNIPTEIKDIFPIIFNYDSNNKWYEMENINGIPISKLYLNEELTIHQFSNIIGTINRIHNCKNTDHCNKEPTVNIYGNYVNKLKKRYLAYDYSKFYESEKIYNFLVEKLELYEKQNLGKYAVIHGDTVFTNILINKFGKIKLIDMRGEIDNILTIYGDKLYDWAKIYQSILGYDEILENKSISDLYKERILNYFEEQFLILFSENDLYNLKIITASLIFTLIPLHNNEKCNNYYKIIEKIKIDF